MRSRNWLFGRQSPGFLVKFGYFCLTLIGFVFFAWNVLSSLALQMRFVINENKNVSVKDFLAERAVELEIHPDYILPKLLTFFSVSALCWGVFLFGLVLLWRQKAVFFWVAFGSVLFYIGMALFYVGGLFFWEEFTDMDKVFLFIILVSIFLYRFLLFKKAEE